MKTTFEKLHEAHTEFANTKTFIWKDYDLWRKLYENSAGRSMKVLNKIQVRETFAVLLRDQAFIVYHKVPESIKTVDELIMWMKS